MIIRLLVAAVVSMAAILGMPTGFLDSESVPMPDHRTLAGVYFQETGQYLEQPLLEFWSEHGGVPVFGFPISAAFEQTGRTVQYFERAVLEVHPDNPLEWEVLSRRLGVEAAGPDHRKSPVFTPTPVNNEGFYVETTGHSVSDLFLDYWNKHGGVRIFGFPISVAFQRNGTTIQYFERAVFEFHAKNPEGWQVMQLRLGAEAAQSDGVDTAPVPYDGRTPVYHPDLLGRGGAGLEDRVVYLTFDDGPDADWTPQILNVLEKHNATATFFVLGANAGSYPDLLDDIASSGHVIANHSYDHSSMAGMPFAEFDWQIRSTEHAVARPMAPCMRPPYGAMDANTGVFASQLGYEVRLWDVDPRDWERPGASVIADRVLQQVQPGDIVLLHDGGGDRSQTVQALDAILDKLAGLGYRFAAVCR